MPTRNRLDAVHSYAVAIAAGAEVEHEPRDEPWGCSGRYRNVDGNVIELAEPLPRG